MCSGTFKQPKTSTNERVENFRKGESEMRSLQRSLFDELKELRTILQKGWSERTTYDAENYPYAGHSYGQCYVTARALNYVFGWKILHTRRNGANHYWNVLPDGTEVDFSSDQMGGNGIFIVPSMEGTGKPRIFKPFGENFKNCNPRLKRYLREVVPKLESEHKCYSGLISK